jgi:membrane-associated phospholipid phosphatase
MESQAIERWERFRERLPRSRYLAIHLVAGWLLSFLLLCLFLFISRMIGRGSRVAHWDEAVAARCYEHRESSPIWRHFFLFVTEAGSARTLTGIVVGVSIALAWLHRRLLLFIVLLGPLAGGIIDSGLKEWFERPRPTLHDMNVFETSMSFPSGHSLGSMVTYGLLAYCIVEMRHRRRIRWLAVPVAAAMVGLIGLSRIYLNAHYPTDVLAGWTVGACWLASCITAVESIKVHHHARTLKQVAAQPG